MDKINSRFMVTSKKLDKIPDDGIVDDVERDDLTIKTFFPQDEEENKKTCEIQECFIELNRVKHGIQRGSREAADIFITESDSPGERTLRTPAASCTETSQTTKTVAEGKSRTDDICGFPDRDFISTEKPESEEESKSQSSLKNTSGSCKGKKLFGILKIIGHVAKEKNEFRTQQCNDDGKERHIEKF